MEPRFWLERWRLGQIGFHQPTIDRSLRRHWPSLMLAPRSERRSRIFVPLCGKSLDMLWLRDEGHEVFGVELSAAALEAFCVENGVPARRRPDSSFDWYEAGDLTLACGDFFDLTPGRIGAIDAVYDRAALISWAAERRGAYVEHLASLIRAPTAVLLITLEYDQAQMPGPPFSVPALEVKSLYAPHFSVRELERRDILEEEPRFKARGIGALTEVCYHLVRT